MHEVEMHQPTEAFAQCWEAAVRHIQRQAQGPLRSWLKIALVPPFLEHLSFRLGNQLFFIRLEDRGGALEAPGNPGGLLRIADGCAGHPCLMPMRAAAGVWSPDEPGWGLVHARTGDPVVPPALITDELVEITDWEVHGCAVQLVRDDLRTQGRQLMSWVDDPAVDPSVWFIGDEGPEWVVVRGVRYPALDASPPDNWAAIARSCRRVSPLGHFASVSLANTQDPFLPDGEGALPLWRGHAMWPRYLGLVRVDDKQPQGLAAPGFPPAPRSCRIS